METALSAVHILTWSPELCLAVEVAKESCGSCLFRLVLIKEVVVLFMLLREEFDNIRAANMIDHLIFICNIDSKTLHLS